MVAELSLRIPGGSGAPAEARAALRRFHPDLAPELMQIVTLLASELVSNAVRHGRSAWVELCFAAEPRQVRIEVADEGAGFDGRSLPMERSSAGGWGLHIVDELASRWGIVKGRGTRVWFEIDR